MQGWNTLDTIVAPATAPGMGAIGIIRLSGPDALQIASRVFKGKDLTKQKSHTLHFGQIADEHREIDEVVLSLFLHPKSYTGDDVVEISTHGSQFIMQQVVELLVRHGARMAKPGEFTLRAFLNKKLDLSQAEAVADLIASENKAMHQTAMQQMRGGFSARIRQLRERLIHFASLIELELDFSEEDVEFANRNDLQLLVNEIMEVVHQLSESFQYGNVIKNGVPVVIAGKPNAGKSTLLNALLNEERAIVSPMAGTTRDTIEEVLHIEGIAFRFIDTAGIRNNTDSEIETIGVERTFSKMSEASVVVLLFDINQTNAEELKKQVDEIKLHSTAKIIFAANKTDLNANPKIQELFTGFRPLIFMSSLRGSGVEDLKKKLLDTMKYDVSPNDTVITNLRHYEALQSTYDALSKVMDNLNTTTSGELLAFDIRKALFHLGEITGEITTDDLLENIFSKFCIGK